MGIQIIHVIQRSEGPIQSSWQNAPHFLHINIARRSQTQFPPFPIIIRPTSSAAAPWNSCRLLLWLPFKGTGAGAEGTGLPSLVLIVTLSLPLPLPPTLARALKRSKSCPTNPFVDELEFPFWVVSGMLMTGCWPGWLVVTANRKQFRYY